MEDAMAQLFGSRLLQSTVLFLAGFLVGALTMTWPARGLSSTLMVAANEQPADRCAGGDEVSRFKCRNSFMLNNRLAR
jgi:hypothetical protein